MLLGSNPAPPSTEVPNEEPPPPGIVAAGNEEAFDSQYGEAPAQPDDQSRVISEPASQQPRYRRPALVREEKCGHPVFWLAVADCDASLTVSCAQVVAAQDMAVPPGKKESAHPVVSYSAALGALFKMRFEGCTCVPGVTDKV